MRREQLEKRRTEQCERAAIRSEESMSRRPWSLSITRDDGTVATVARGPSEESLVGLATVLYDVPRRIMLGNQLVRELAAGERIGAQ